MGIVRGRNSRTAINARPGDAPANSALVGYWACDEGSGDILHDLSGKGYNLQIELSDESNYGFGSISNMWSHKPGYLSMKNGDRAFIDIASAPLLDTGTNHVIVCCALQNGTVLDDCDLGTAWDVRLAETGGYRGFAISTLGSIQGFRTSVFDEGNGQTGHTDLFWDQAIEGAAPVNAVNGLAGAWVPSDTLKLSVNGEILIEDATAYSELEVTSGQFALKSAYNGASSEQVITGTSIRDFQIWSFSTLPDNLDETLIWMSANPGKIPGWWL